MLPTASVDEVPPRLDDWSVLTRLLGLLSPYWGEVAASVLCALFATALQIINPLLLSIAIDKYFLHHEPAIDWLRIWLPQDAQRGLLLLSVLFFAGVVLSFLFQSLHAYLAQSSGQKAMADLRHRIFTHLHRLPVAFYDVTPVGRLVTRATTDVEALNDLYTNGIVSVLANSVMTLCFLAAALHLNSHLSIVLLAFLPLFTIMTLCFRRIITRSQQYGRILLARINSFIAENVGGIDVVHLFNRQKPHLERFDEMNSAYNTTSMQWVTANAWFMPVVEILGTISQAALLFMGAWLLQDGQLSIGVIVAFLQYATLFLRPIQEIGERYGVLQSSVVSAEKVFGLLDMPLSRLQDGGASPALAHAEIEFDHVWFAYKGDEWILQDVSFKVASGESLAIVGHTGAGKTTIVNLLLRFYEPQRGVIRVGGVDIRSIPASSLRNRFGVVLQDTYVREGSILDNLRFGALGDTEAQVHRAAEKTGLLMMADHFSEGLHTQVHERGDNLSSGQKQLIAMARAMARDPDLLILDEATANVDSETEERMQKAVEMFLRGRTSVIIAHRLATILHADNIIVMHKGRVAESGNHRALIHARGLYWRLCQLQYGEVATDLVRR
ncbi:ABC transporter related protein [Rhodomicrobium vannielii ATCC 17100]|uniref:ABC transporter related protein n=1 Tax=Rhodomicrobium vannielii (strain ATCC 17100 / DSM 162 / LMG 4299 / NCIMB 10020 / ATH 3.1.1) TaxID=648757 RepID=E3I4W9_RHOVT|nr:ABC transporter ATP-binding protein [Rhodomicrobium vannielii]ADP72791.1 ABC transporter related protein [Rhodomicrobium vannielii ATCC 17100]